MAWILAHDVNLHSGQFRTLFWLSEVSIQIYVHLVSEWISETNIVKLLEVVVWLYLSDRWKVMQIQRSIISLIIIRSYLLFVIYQILV